MSNVLGMDKQKVLQGLFKLGWSDRRINKETGIHRKTIRDYRWRFQNAPKVLTDPPAVFAQNAPKVLTDLSGQAGQNAPKALTDFPALPVTKSLQLQAYLKQVQEKASIGLSARRIYQDLVEECDYQGGYYSVQRYVRKLRKKLPKHFDRLPTLPGLEAQVDFAKGPPVRRNGRYQRAWLFKMTLSFSAQSYEELVWDQKLETFIRCHENAFRDFGGVPERVKLDNLKSGVLQACLYEPVINPLYQAFAEYYGFVPDPCIPRKPEHKGRVERDIRYTEDNALKGLRFENLDLGNARLRHWNRRWARTRIHGSKKMQVWKLFTEYERPALKPLPESPFACFKIGPRKVDTTGYIEVAGNFYSVPHRYIGQKLTVHFNQQYIKVYDGMDLLVRHTPRSGKGSIASVPGHKPPYKPLSQEQAEGWLCQKARQAGPSCHKLVYAILSGSDSDPMAIRRCRGILGLAKKYPFAIDEACRKALLHHRYQYRLVKSWCETAGSEPSAPPALTQEHDLIRSTKEYQTLIDGRS